jgi:F0F1-type ATP synthase assembly protein I
VGESDPKKIPPGAIRAAAVAWTLPFELIVPPLAAGGVGYLLDLWWHSKPIFMLVLGLAGMVLGIVNAVKTASLLDKNGR